MSWICPKCETENPDRLKVCEVCDSPRTFSPVEELKEKLKKKYSDAAYKSFIRDHYVLLDSADKGDIADQYQVGEWFLEHGSTRSSDDYYKIAVVWYRKAALKEHIVAQIRLASCYEEGRGVPQMKNEAMKWYKKAADQGTGGAKVKYVELKYNNKTYKNVIRYRSIILYDADCGNRHSQYLIGEWFRSHDSQSTYRKEAVVWYTKAAMNGHSDAMYKLGECYENGVGVYSSISEALKWYRKAAENGNDAAQKAILNLLQSNSSNSNPNSTSSNSASQPSSDNSLIWVMAIIIIIVLIIAYGLSLRDTKKNIQEPIQTESKKEPLMVVDYEKPFITISSTSASFNSSGGTYTFVVNSNTPWHISEYTYEWGHLSRSGNKIKLKVDANPSVESRNDYFIISSGNENVKVTIYQAGTSNVYLDVSHTNISFPSSGGKQTININTNVEWYFSRNIGEPWAHLSRTGNRLELSVEANTSTSQRGDFFRVKAGNLEETIYMTQSGY